MLIQKGFQHYGHEKEATVFVKVMRRQSSKYLASKCERSSIEMRRSTARKISPDLIPRPFCFHPLVLKHDPRSLQTEIADEYNLLQRGKGNKAQASIGLWAQYPTASPGRIVPCPCQGKERMVGYRNTTKRDL